MKHSELLQDPAAVARGYDFLKTMQYAEDEWVKYLNGPEDPFDDYRDTVDKLVTEGIKDHHLTLHNYETLNDWEYAQIGKGVIRAHLLAQSLEDELFQNNEPDSTAVKRRLLRAPIAALVAELENKPIAVKSLDGSAIKRVPPYAPWLRTHVRQVEGYMGTTVYGFGIFEIKTWTDAHKPDYMVSAIDKVDNGLRVTLAIGE